MKIVAAKKILKANDQLAEENRRSSTPRACSASTWSARPAAARRRCWRRSSPQLEGPAGPGGDRGRHRRHDRRRADRRPGRAGRPDQHRRGLPPRRQHDRRRHRATSTSPAIDLLVIENVGNLVCTAGFDLGEHLRIVVLERPRGRRQAGQVPGVCIGVTSHGCAKSLTRRCRPRECLVIFWQNSLQAGIHTK